jgi:quinol-cytochrome oxidoreductase complex cytochrome b subunit
MNAINFFIFLFSINIISFVLMNYMAFQTKKAEVWKNAIQNNFIKVVVFIFAIPLFLFFLFNFVKGVIIKNVK